MGSILIEVNHVLYVVDLLQSVIHCTVICLDIVVILFNKKEVEVCAMGNRMDLFDLMVKVHILNLILYELV